MIAVDSMRDLAQYTGKYLGHSDWILIDQPLINRFADVTGDHFWVHEDVERASRELPKGKTIAHGLLAFSLIPSMYYQVVSVRQYGLTFSYGANKLRYVAPVHSGDRIRLHVTLLKFDEIEGGLMTTVEYRVEIEGSEKPALVAEMMTVAYD